jgi:hypothetical protein
VDAKQDGIYFVTYSEDVIYKRTHTRTSPETVVWFTYEENISPGPSSSSSFSFWTGVIFKFLLDGMEHRTTTGKKE